ncbi:hypothetical protein M427DRAFT_56901 [Gonapodya prolifera JEL478]|uniref:SnoaL-like domain-containing protein n=1 Tax=Gonapodya prolifera (strain JEL478) TaxID=1344416 RepID=A0A139AFT2_GONPJ|nr:hypothetical protein M427DRAFT_56901 [Gonapodya prolifera JEL478]|eukprot:KXS15273.1 hypothetical protein M427DRAFT_56901 [Gonapodya prolifera JEL478]
MMADRPQTRPGTDYRGRTRVSQVTGPLSPQQSLESQESTGPPLSTQLKEKLRKSYHAFASGEQEWKTVYHPSCSSVFAGAGPNLSRFPKGFQEFWAVFDVLVEVALEEVVTSRNINIVAWDDGHAFVTSKHRFTSVTGDSWEGSVLNRMKYNQEGLIVDQALFVENLARMEAFVGGLFAYSAVTQLLKERRLVLRNSP